MKLTHNKYILIVTAIVSILITSCSSISKAPISQGYNHPRLEYKRQDYIVLSGNSTSNVQEAKIPLSWRGRRLFLVENSEVGEKWIENEVTDSIFPGKVNAIHTRSDKAYLEARGYIYIQSLRFTPDIDKERVYVEITLDSKPKHGTNVALTFRNGEYLTVSVPTEEKTTTLEIPTPMQGIWTKDVPYLFEVTAIVGFGRRTIDAVDSYFLLAN